MSLLRTLVDDHKYRDVVGSTPETITIIRSFGLEKPNKGCEEALAFMASTGVGEDLYLHKNLVGSSRKRLSQPARNDPVAVALVILERFRANVLEPALGHPNFPALHKDLLIVDWLLHSNYPSYMLRALVPAIQLPWSDAKVMICLASNTYTDVPDAFISQCLAFCAIYTCMLLSDSEDACTWVVQAMMMRSWFQHYWSQHAIFQHESASSRITLLRYSGWHTTQIYGLSFRFSSNGTIPQKNQAPWPWRSNYRERFIPRCLENAQRDRDRAPTHQSALWCQEPSLLAILRQSSGTITLKCWILSNLHINSAWNSTSLMTLCAVLDALFITYFCSKNCPRKIGLEGWSSDYVQKYSSSPTKYAFFCI